MPVRTLKATATGVCINNLGEIHNLGLMPFRCAKAILERVQDPDQLARFELHSPHLALHTADIWLRLIRRDFPEYDDLPIVPTNPASWSKVYRKYKSDAEKSMAAAMQNLKNELVAITSEKLDKRTNLLPDLIVPYEKGKPELGPKLAQKAARAGRGLPMTGGRPASAAMQKIQKQVYQSRKIRGPTFLNQTAKAIPPPRPQKPASTSQRQVATAKTSPQQTPTMTTAQPQTVAAGPNPMSPKTSPQRPSPMNAAQLQTIAANRMSPKISPQRLPSKTSPHRHGVIDGRVSKQPGIAVKTGRRVTQDGIKQLDAYLRDHKDEIEAARESSKQAVLSPILSASTTPPSSSCSLTGSPRRPGSARSTSSPQLDLSSIPKLDLAAGVRPIEPAAVGSSQPVKQISTADIRSNSPAKQSKPAGVNPFQAARQSTPVQAIEPTKQSTPADTQAIEPAKHGMLADVQAIGPTEHSMPADFQAIETTKQRMPDYASRIEPVKKTLAPRKLSLAEYSRKRKASQMSPA